MGKSIITHSCARALTRARVEEVRAECTVQTAAVARADKELGWLRQQVEAAERTRAELEQTKRLLFEEVRKREALEVRLKRESVAVGDAMQTRLRAARDAHVAATDEQLAALRTEVGAFTRQPAPEALVRLQGQLDERCDAMRVAALRHLT